MAICNKALMCDLGLNTPEDTKKWILKNHPDKGGQVDSIIFKDVKEIFFVEPGFVRMGLHDHFLDTLQIFSYKTKSILNNVNKSLSS
jgi:hypothetical protein